MNKRGDQERACWEGVLVGVQRGQAGMGWTCPQEGQRRFNKNEEAEDEWKDLHFFHL